MNEQQKTISDALYCIAMRLTDMGVKNVDELIKRLCKEAGVNCPPQQMEVVCQSQL